MLYYFFISKPVGYIQTAVDGALERGKHLGAGRCARQASVEHTTERTGSIINGLDEEVLARDLRHACSSKL